MTALTREEILAAAKEIAKAESDYERVPKLFIRFIVAVAALLLPWGIWVTVTLMKIQAGNEARVDDRHFIRAQMQGHLSDTSIHHTAIQRIETRLTHIESRLDRLERP